MLENKKEAVPWAFGIKDQQFGEIIVQAKIQWNFWKEALGVHW